MHNTQFLRLHLIPTLLIKLIPSRSKFLRNNITKIHQITKSLLQCLESGSIFCYSLVWFLSRPHILCIQGGFLPVVWIRRCIFASEGWGIVYPQNSTAGLRNETPISSARFSLVPSGYNLVFLSGCNTYFFIIAYRKALPIVWPSPSNWKDADVSEDPGS